MASLKTLTVQQRSDLGKGPNRRLRQKDLIPGVFYASSGENIPIQTSSLPLNKMFNEMGRTTVFNLEIETQKKTVTHPVLFWQTQYHPVKNRFIHVDFYGVDLKKPIKIIVPIEFNGIARGTKVGGKLETYHEQVCLMAKPLDMPAKISIDISDLDIGKSIQVMDIPLPKEITAVYDKNYTIVSVIMPGGNTAAEQQDE